MLDSIAFIIFVGMIFYVIYKSVVNDDLVVKKDRRFRPAPPAHGPQPGAGDAPLDESSRQGGGPNA